MRTSTESVRLRVVSGNVKCWGVTIPQGEYEGHIDWEFPDDEAEPRMSAVQLIPEKLPELANKPCEVRQYLMSGDIEPVGSN